jgi:DNA-binding transcriptional ArsR family regulator
MSNLQKTLALNTKTGSSTRKLILFKLADQANDLGECYPSLRTICEHCEISKNTALSNIRKLEEMGLVDISQRRDPKGRQTSNRYQLKLQGSVSALCDSLQGAAVGGDQGAAVGGDQGAAVGGVITLNHHNEPSKRTNISNEVPQIIPDKPGGYYEFIKEYPKIGKWDSPRLKSAYHEAVHELDGHDPLMFALKLFAEVMKIKDVGQYEMTNPENWLKRGQYNVDWSTEKTKALNATGQIDWSAIEGADVEY